MATVQQSGRLDGLPVLEKAVKGIPLESATLKKSTKCSCCVLYCTVGMKTVLYAHMLLLYNTVQALLNLMHGGSVLNCMLHGKRMSE